MGKINSRIAAVALGLVVLGGMGCRRAAEPAQAAEVPPAPAPAPEVLATVGGKPITVEDLTAEWGRRRSVNSEAQPGPKELRAALDALIERESVYAQAVASGFDRSPEMQLKIRRLVVNHFKQSQLPEEAPAVTDAEIEQRYRSEMQRWQLPPATRGAVLMVSVPSGASDERRSALRDQALGYLAEVSRNPQDEVFTRLVAEHSDHQPSRFHGGDTGWVSEGSAGTDPAVARALLALSNPGEVAPLVETPAAFYVVRLKAKRPPQQRSLAEVAPVLRGQLVREKREAAERAFRDAMRAGLDIQILSDRLSVLSLTNRAGVGPATASSGLPSMEFH